MQQESEVYAHGVSSLTAAEVEQDSTLSHILPANQNLLVITVEMGKLIRLHYEIYNNHFWVQL